MDVKVGNNDVDYDVSLIKPSTLHPCAEVGNNDAEQPPVCFVSAA